MNTIDVVLLRKVGDISFGMSRSQVRDIMGEYKEFKKSKFSKNTTDDFGICHIYYDSNNECEAIELFGDVSIKIDEQIILPNKFDKLCSLLSNIDNEIEIEADGCTSINYSIGVYSPNEKVESILFGKDGYYSI